MADAVLFYVFGYREAHLADLLIQEWQHQGRDVRGHAYCYRGAAADLLRSSPNRWPKVVSDREVLKERRAMPSAAKLGDLERRYGTPNLWRHAVWDRHLTTKSRGGNLYGYGSRRTRQEILRTIAARLICVEDLIERGQPRSTIFVSIDVGSGSALAVHQVAQFHGSPITVPVPNRLGTGTLFFDDVRAAPDDLVSEYRRRRDGHSDEWSDAATKLIEEFKSGKAGMRVKEKSVSPPQDGTRLDRARAAPDQVPLALRDRAVRVARGRYARKKFAANPLPEDQNFILMPLHLEPELALLAYAPEHYDQVATIRQVAQATPVSTALAVREHPVVQGQRPMSHYREISSIPNTVWNNSQVPSRTEMRRSRAVVSVTGSAVLEAAILGVPNLLLGRVWFDFCESVHQELTPADLPGRLSDPDTLAPDPDDVHAFVSAVLSLSSSWAVSAVGKKLCDVPLDQARKDDRFREYERILCRRIEQG